ncbi:DUF1353 domain-containing protein [Salipiger sp. 1_MG-2023]|uniref:DUF1353 domain-containing protein n=1 Tax=Salipiger sp. 1_MG-2023 TaxID=3062665 RepID=UPI0026E2A8E0|nr:DUF1353 domain-containing protein [Salipiger sp. 1_MG-2023]MDO6586474.1 DUF1353 domain-containing protein [Salipiger sp. 1_MG-2023]
MTRFQLFGLIPAVLCAASACAPTQQAIDDVDALSQITCATHRANCAYLGSPVKVSGAPITLPSRPYKFFRMSAPMQFRDARGRTWVAPSGTLTDGASIPPIFVSIVGEPRAPEYANAGALHDAYCGIGNEGGLMYHEARWQDVHRMFFDGLIASGTPERRAMVMFAAVWLGGPRWQYRDDLARMPVPVMQRAMRDARDYIERDEPSFAELMRYLRWLENRVLRQNAEYARERFGDDHRIVPRDRPEDEEPGSIPEENSPDITAEDDPPSDTFETDGETTDQFAPG